MKTITVILVSLLLTSCMTTKRVKRNCDLFADVCITETETNTETKTEIITETEYRDTTILVYISEDKVKDKIPVRIEDENRKPIPVKKEYVNSELSVLKVPFAKSTAQVINSKLSHELIQTDTVLLFKLQNAIKTVKRQEKVIKVLSEKYLVEVEVNKPFAKFAIKWFFGSLLLALLGIGFLIFKYKTRILGLFK